MKPDASAREVSKTAFGGVGFMIGEPIDSANMSTLKRCVVPVFVIWKGLEYESPFRDMVNAGTVKPPAEEPKLAQNPEKTP